MAIPNGFPKARLEIDGGDSLQAIAYESYRDATKWRAIAEANGIDDPLHLKRGSVLSIPRIED